MMRVDRVLRLTHEPNDSATGEKRDPDRGKYRLSGVVMGLVAGTFFGVGLVTWFGPRSVSELGKRVPERARVPWTI
ncbi:MAG: hypothetical protein ACRD2N_11545 [Vicinamibacterales bacterium]